MSTTPKQTSTTALEIMEPTPEHRVCLMDDGTIRVTGLLTVLTRAQALKIAYALMSAGAKL